MALQLRLLHSHSNALPLLHEVSAVLHIWVSEEVVLSAARCQLIRKVPRVHARHVIVCVQVSVTKKSDFISIRSDGSVHNERGAHSASMF